ncbi:hypothetical protein CYLTODRAFT_419061 [Cylindrobasidium torrendii FP15055 ss-10]|uniref:Glycoside hydrolase family 16 protein n=1 Tax=Cylindrobasidium torrendii FP15055 ss-10 TaxID=1314674 RepID=A0A0D7BM48_9AGAR|nr:hypothetical protein CYLTODRAFT_419061 [Cylindrobasidium torrendii FP15055 ss-10]
MVSFRTLLTAASALILSTAVVAQTSQGSITQPESNTIIAPGESFPFAYDSVADYSISSYNFSVFLFSKPPKSFDESGDFAHGHYFGRFQVANYPAVPYPSNPAPSELVMPDFSQKHGGFGMGASGANATMYLTVIEEYADGAGVMGFRMSLASTPVIYNGTSA